MAEPAPPIRRLRVGNQGKMVPTDGEAAAPPLTRLPASIRKPQPAPEQPPHQPAQHPQRGPRTSAAKAASRHEPPIFRTWRPTAYDPAFEASDSLTQVSGDALAMRLVVPVLLEEPLVVFPFGAADAAAPEAYWKLVPPELWLQWRALDSDQSGNLIFAAEAPVLREVGCEPQRPPVGATIEVFGALLRFPS